MTSLFEQAHIEIGQPGWLLEGPWMDAKQESSLEEAIDYCESCCNTVCDDYVETNFIPLVDDVDFLKTILRDLQYDNNKPSWQRQIEHLITLAYLKEAAE